MTRRRQVLHGVDVTYPVHHDQKAQQRRYLIGCQLSFAAKRHGGMDRLNLLVVDEFDNNGRLFCTDLIAAGADPRRIWSPNVKPEVVTALQSIGIIHAEECVALMYVERRIDDIRAAGGLHLAFVDVHGGYEQGAGPLVELLADFRLMAFLPEVNYDGDGGAFLCFAASSRGAGLSRAEEATAIGRHVALRMYRSDYFALPVVFPRWLRSTYFTMQFYAWNIVVKPRCICMDMMDNGHTDDIQSNAEVN